MIFCFACQWESRVVAGRDYYAIMCSRFSSCSLVCGSNGRIVGSHNCSVCWMALQQREPLILGASKALAVMLCNRRSCDMRGMTYFT